VPLTAFWVMPAGLLALALMPLHLEALALAPMGWGIAALLWIARAVAAWPDAVLAVPHMPDWGLLLLSLGIAWLGLWRTRLRLAGLAAIALALASPAFERPPDILVSADARLIGLRTPQGVFLQAGPGAAGFTRDAWLQYWAVATAAPLPATGEAGGVSCTADACTLRRGVSALLLRGGGGCDAAVLVSAEPIREDCPATVARVDRFSVWRDGAHAIWLDPGGPRILSDRTARGDRPWVPPSPTRVRTPPGLTPALAEDLPD
jgi:competence protein ComEC